ncbi:hypothetical protein CspHIS471_0607070 [Cutaneotrichosporon sp. HIS471]|nr:hypothetical protein CspHIS471_0607070 [Cutaneotrichosporon sp. HIS471]
MAEHHTIACSLDATQRVLQCPHIIDSIMEYATPRARAVCLRVSRRFHTPAARALYHTVCLSQSNMEAFFRGALVGNGGEDALSECGLAKERGKCMIHVPEHLEKFAIWNSTADTRPAGDSSTVNMKGPLLKFVRVLTIAQHHSCVCYAYGPHAKSLLPNLYVVRVAPEPRGSHSFEVQCPCDSGHCALLGGIHTHKLVLRNLDGGGVALLDGVCEE